MGLDIPLIEQPPVRLAGTDVSQVVEHLVPEPRIQQVQHGMFHAADIQIDTARVIRAMFCRARAQPVCLVLLVAEGFCVVGVGVAQFIPGAARPLRHHVGVPRVVLEPVAEVQLDIHPVGGLGQRG
ncbi:Uncharacterised protein [Mycobacteroides abscessus subsp. abscessus]|nr:Uncharacterised protein [Mycobacteroides abscessus subsp. abscessus]